MDSIINKNLNIDMSDLANKKENSKENSPIKMTNSIENFEVEEFLDDTQNSNGNVKKEEILSSEELKQKMMETPFLNFDDLFGDNEIYKNVKGILSDVVLEGFSGASHLHNDLEEADSIEDFGALIKNCGASLMTFHTSSINGILNAGEGIVDGLVTLDMSLPFPSPTSGLVSPGNLKKLADGVGSIMGSLGNEDVQKTVNNISTTVENGVSNFIKNKNVDNLFENFWNTGAGEILSASSYLKHDGTIANSVKEANELTATVAVDFVPVVGPVLSVLSTVGSTTEESLNAGNSFSDASKEGLLWGTVDAAFSVIPGAAKGIKGLVSAGKVTNPVPGLISNVKKSFKDLKPNLSNTGANITKGFKNYLNFNGNYVYNLKAPSVFDGMFKKNAEKSSSSTVKSGASFLDGAAETINYKDSLRTLKKLTDRYEVSASLKGYAMDLSHFDIYDNSPAVAINLYKKIFDSETRTAMKIYIDFCGLKDVSYQTFKEINPKVASRYTEEEFKELLNLYTEFPEFSGYVPPIENVKTINKPRVETRNVRNYGPSPTEIAQDGFESFDILEKVNSCKLTLEHGLGGYSSSGMSNLAIRKGFDDTMSLIGSRLKIDDMIKIHDAFLATESKYPGLGKKRFQILVDTGDYNVITRSGGARDTLLQYTLNDIRTYLNIIK